MIVNGIILAEDGQKMSKSPQLSHPNDLIDRTGADAIRLLIDSPVSAVTAPETGVREIVKTVLLPLWNARSSPPPRQRRRR